MEYEESKAKAEVLLDSLIQSFSVNDRVMVDEKILRTTFEHVFNRAYECGKRDGIEFALAEVQKNK